MVNPKSKSIAASVASLFSREDLPDDDDIPGIFSMSIRMPIRLAATVSTMAQHAGRSRNEMAILILSAGVTAILEQTPEPIGQAISEDIQENISNFT